MAFRSPNGRALVEVDLVNGGRIASLRLDGRELLVTNAAKAIDWGFYPMVPFAGRIRNGRIDVDGLKAQLPATEGDHAIHGYGHVNPWTKLDDRSFQWDFSDPWPWRGSATQTIDLADDQVTLSMTIKAHERQPVVIGWHPWFRRDIGGPHLAVLQFDAGSMLERDSAGLPSGAMLSPPPAGPWDDCFTEVGSHPIVSWGDLEIELASTAEYWTVYDMPAHALCVEPQTGPPNGVNSEVHVVEAGKTLAADFRISWSRSPAGESET